MTIEQVFSRQGKTTHNGLLIKKRIIAAVHSMNGNCEAALTNLGITIQKDYSLGTIQVYWSDFNKLSQSEQTRFLESSTSDLLKSINLYAELKD